MKNVKYLPKPGFSPGVNFQTSVGLITLTTGDNLITDEQHKELTRLYEQPSFKPYDEVIDLNPSSEVADTALLLTTPPTPAAELEISLMTAENAIAAVAKIKDLATLQALKEEEQEVEKRTTVLKAIDKAISMSKQG